MVVNESEMIGIDACGILEDPFIFVRRESEAENE